MDRVFEAMQAMRKFIESTGAECFDVASDG